MGNHKLNLSSETFQFVSEVVAVLLFPLYREIFPYLVVVIGLENVLVLTKSVVSTPVDLEVKLRIAQGEDRVCVDCACCSFRYRNTSCTTFSTYSIHY